MSQLTVCDECGKQQKDPHGWLEIRFTRSHDTFTAYKEPMELCSWTCMLACAQKTVEWQDKAHQASRMRAR